VAQMAPTPPLRMAPAGTPQAVRTAQAPPSRPGPPVSAPAASPTMAMRYGLGGVLANYDEPAPPPLPLDGGESAVRAPFFTTYRYNPDTGMIEQG
jgi:hypothetical protein